MADKDRCKLIRGEARKLCEQGPDHPGTGGGGGGATPPGQGDGITGGASQHVRDLAEYLIKKISGLVAPKQAPMKSDSGFYEPFLWLGQHLAVAIFVCVVVVCGLTAWQGAPRLRQLGASTGWTLAAVAGMASVPGIVVLLNEAVSSAFTAAFNSNESTLFSVVSNDLKKGADSDNPLAILIIVAALVVALGFATLVFMTRQLGILAFVCMAPLVLASLARGGDMTAVKQWAMRLLGLMFAPLALLLVSPFVELAKGSLVVDSVLLVAADVLMLQMIVHGIPYVGPRVAGAARTLVERNTDNPLARAVVRAGVPDVYERENAARRLRTVDTPGRALHKDRSVLFAAYGIKQQQQRPGQLTTASTIAQVRERAARTAEITQARQQARATVQSQAPAARPRPASPQSPTPNRQPSAPNPRPAPNPPSNP